MARRSGDDRDTILRGTAVDDLNGRGAADDRPGREAGGGERAQSATFTVTTAADVVDAADGVLSLREAVAAANATAAADTIRFAEALEGRTLTLTQGQLSLAADVTIDGDRDDDGARVNIDGDRNGRVFAVTGDGTDASLTGLGVTGGYVATEGGGGILLRAGNALTLSDCTVSNNQTSGFPAYFWSGGGVLAEASSRLAVDRSTFTDNYAPNGGAIAAVGAAAVTLNRTVFSSNSGGVGGHGGGLSLSNVAAAEIGRCTIAGNRSYYGAGMSIRGGSALVRGSTIADNVGLADFNALGTGIYTTGELVLRNSTVTGNRSADSVPGYGAGIGIFDAGSLDIANSIVAGNFAIPPDTDELLADDISGRIVASNGHNVFGSAISGAVAGDVQDVAAARLFAAIDPETGGGVLALNGGPTPTVALRDALDNPALSGADPLDADSTDQRGVERPLPSHSNPDIGSFELHQRALSTQPSANNDVLTGTARADTLIALAGNDLVRGLGGNDDLRGVGGSDTLAGGAGGDRLDGGSGNDLLLGGGGADRLLGSFGADALFGGSGGDLLRGQLGADRLRGEGGADVFDLDPGDSGVGAARRDLILDFTRGADRIDLATIDAKSGGGDDAFEFVGRQGPDEHFSRAGQLRFFQTGGSTFVQGNTDADAAPEFELQLTGTIGLTAGDFVL